MFTRITPVLKTISLIQQHPCIESFTAWLRRQQMFPLSLDATAFAEVQFPWWQCRAHTPVPPLWEAGCLQQHTQNLICFWPETPAAGDNTPRHFGLHMLTPETCQTSKLQGAKARPDGQPSKWEEASFLGQPSQRLQAAREGRLSYCSGTRRAGEGDNPISRISQLQIDWSRESARVFFL